VERKLGNNKKIKVAQGHFTLILGVIEGEESPPNPREGNI